VEHEEPAVLVIDSFKALRDLLGEAAAMRTFIYDLAIHTSAWGAVSLFVGEYTPAEIADLPEFAIADGIIRLSNQRHELTTIREVEVLKLRGANFVTGAHFFEIGRDGLAFFPRVRSRAPADGGTRRARLDKPAARRDAGGAATRSDVIGAGPERQDLLGCSTSRAPTRNRDLPSRRPPPASRHAPGLGPRPLEARGLFSFYYVSPVELSTDVFLDRARQEVERLGARRAVLDSLTSMSLGVPSERRFKELVYALTKHFRAAGVTLNMNMEIADLLGTAQLSGHGISFAADNVIQLKYVEVMGCLERGISVLKARGVHHATDMRRLRVGPDRIDVESAFAGLRGVLTGLPVPLGSSEK
jgi:circadian clock protein KaiC